MPLPRDLSLAETKALLELVKQRQGFTSDIEAGQWLLERQRANLAVQHREPTRRDTQAPNYGLVNSLMDAGKKSPRSFYGPPRYKAMPQEVKREPADLGSIEIWAEGGPDCPVNDVRITRGKKRRRYTVSHYSFERLARIAQGKAQTNKYIDGRIIDRPFDLQIISIKVSRYPEAVTFYGAMGVHAARRRSYVGGGWRAYVLGKALDRHGLGMVKRDDLQAYALALGVHIRTWQRWLKQARNHDLLIDIQKGDDWYFRLPGPGAAAYGMGCEVGRRKIELRADLLIGNGWKAFVWAATEAAGPHGIQITRERLQKAYNVPVSTQRYRDAQAGVKRTRNYSNSGIEIKPDELTMVREESSHKGAFIAGNKNLYWRLPDTRATDQAVFVGRGRSRKAIAKLRILQDKTSLLQKQRALSDDHEVPEYIRLFNHTQAQLKASKKKLARSERVQEVYLISHLADSGAGIWEHCPK